MNGTISGARFDEGIREEHVALVGGLQAWLLSFSSFYSAIEHSCLRKGDSHIWVFQDWVMLASAQWQAQLAPPCHPT
jgi:hypothetical protein